VKGRIVKRASVLFFLLVFLPASAHLVQGKERDTFSISLVQRALVKKMEGGEVICEDYTVEKGDHIWQLLRERGLLERPDLAQLLDLLKGVNKSLTNLDLIRPGETILIPLNIIPVSAFGPRKGFVKESIMGVSLLKDIDFENYVVRPGDSLTLIAQDRYKVPTGYLYKEYLALVRTFNPALKNPNLIYPNQVIRLPIYSPKMVRVSIKPEKARIASERTETSGAEGCGKASSLMEKLRDIFTQMGEEWIDSGEQFIPLKSGAQINVKADSFPSLNFSSGRRLVIDLRNELPADICQLIESDWEDYKIVHLAPTDNLKAVMDKILAVSNYYKILKSGERFEVGGDIDISVAGDWVIIPYRGEPGADDRITAISLIDDPSEKTPSVVRAYLEKLGIKVIDYPDFPARGDGKEGVLIAQKIETKEDMEFPLPTALLKLAGQPSSSHVKMPIYQGESSKFNLIIQADLFFNRNGKDCIIDLTGLAPAILSLLEKHQFLVLSLAGVKDVYRMTELILDFLGLPFNSKPHRILAAARDEARTIAFTIPGISFHDQERRTIFATGTRMAGEIVSFLNQKGYNLLELSQFQNKRQKPATNGQ
jgi:LysM repeat protein